MKSKNDFRKQGKALASDSGELRRGTKLKPVPKEKNIKRSLYNEIDDLDDLEDALDDEEFFDDDDAYDEDEDDDF